MFDVGLFFYAILCVLALRNSMRTSGQAWHGPAYAGARVLCSSARRSGMVHLSGRVKACGVQPENDQIIRNDVSFRIILNLTLKNLKRAQMYQMSKLVEVLKVSTSGNRVYNTALWQCHGNVMAIQEQLSALRFSTMILGKSSTFYLDAFTEAEIFFTVPRPADISYRVNLHRNNAQITNTQKVSVASLSKSFPMNSIHLNSLYCKWPVLGTLSGVFSGRNLVFRILSTCLTAFVALLFVVRRLPEDETEKESSATDNLYPPHVFTQWTLT